MPPPPKWHLKQVNDDDDDGISIILCDDKGEELKNPRTDQSLGRILEACKSKTDKYPCEGITVSLLYAWYNTVYNAYVRLNCQ